MDQEKYTFTWQNYSDLLRNIFLQMNSDDSFTDVTLITDDKKQIKAHRNILSACSSVFKEIFQINSNNNHSVIYLRGIQHSDMESILQFIYLGETNLYKERLNEFLIVAKDLGIQELGDGIEVEDFISNNDNEYYSTIEAEESPIKKEDEMEEPNKLDVHDDDQHNQSVSKTKKYGCQECDKRYTKKTHLKVHIKSVHEGVKYPCNQCGYQASQKVNLRSHIQSIHEGIKRLRNEN